MTISNFTRLTGLLLVAGFFISCSTSQVNIDELLANNKYQEAITEIDNRLAENPEQPSLYIQKATINADLANQADPELRAEFYENTADNFELAVEYGADASQVSVIDSLRQQYWKKSTMPVFGFQRMKIFLNDTSALPFIFKTHLFCGKMPSALIKTFRLHSLMWEIWTMPSKHSKRP
ncbi:hypothetical protein [Gracilimonas sediminicola]|uniref:hypothetical protein n=1 Tax=Gracilimonas sediminicola TaxID=2952158 RepID=UPI0038D4A86F